MLVFVPARVMTRSSAANLLVAPVRTSCSCLVLPVACAVRVFQFVRRPLVPVIAPWMIFCAWSSACASSRARRPMFDARSMK